MTASSDTASLVTIWHCRGTGLETLIWAVTLFPVTTGVSPVKLTSSGSGEIRRTGFTLLCSMWVEKQMAPNVWMCTLTYKLIDDIGLSSSPECANSSTVSLDYCIPDNRQHGIIIYTTVKVNMKHTQNIGNVHTLPTVQSREEWAGQEFRMRRWHGILWHALYH